MDYIVLDLEWNQPLSYNSSAYKSVGGKLLFEMIQIGAIRMNDHLEITDSFNQLIQPTHYVKLHPRIKRITGITQEQLCDAPQFAEAAECFHAWCGEDSVILTWGCDDISVLQQNLDFFKYRAPFPAMYDLQREIGGEGLVIGVDEVGRGAIAGPLTVGAVVLPNEPRVWGINDSKQLTPARRESLAAQIADVAVAIGIAHIEPASIDAVGMANALRMAMSQAIEDTGVDPDCVLIDGNPMHVHSKEKTMVKGDAKIAAIAAASIVAKVTRDSLMIAYDSEYPGYHLAECKGYGSAAHIEAIRKNGLTPIHRVSFCGNFLETPALF